MTSEVVIDASVVLQWIFRSPDDEPDAPRALQLLSALGEGAITAIQPPHWLAEVSGVVARRLPARAAEVIGYLSSMDLEVATDLEIYERAVRLASDTDQHVFDTLYDTGAMSRADATLVTADERYYRAASGAGRVVRLCDFTE